MLASAGNDIFLCVNCGHTGLISPESVIHSGISACYSTLDILGILGYGVTKVKNYVISDVGSIQVITLITSVSEVNCVVGQ